MYYTILILGIITIIAVVCRFISFSPEPDFSLYGALSKEGLINRVVSLANESRFYSESGKGLSLHTIETFVKKGYKRLSAKPDGELLDYEKWLYDNYYKINESIQRQKKVLSTYKKLPHVKGLPRLYRLAEVIVKNTDGGFLHEDVRELVSVYNAATPLTFFEILSFKSLLEYALLEFITVFYAKSIVINKNFQDAESDVASKKFNIGAIRYNSYLYRINLCDDIDLKYAINNICSANGQSLEKRAQAFIRLSSYYNGCIGAAVKNLHKLVEMNDEFVLELSALNDLLKNYPPYESDTLATKYAVCYAIARKAKKLRKSELFYARQLSDDYELNGKYLEKEVLVHHKNARAQRFYIIIMLLFSFAFALAGSYLIGEFLLFPLLFPISFAVVKFIQTEIFALSNRGIVLPAKKVEHFENTLITVTRLIKDCNEVEEAFRHIEILRAANGSEFSYALLLDFIDSDSEEKEDDSLIEMKINELFQKSKNRNNINVFLRKRSVCRDGKYRGWEKKRGALIKLNEYLLYGNRSDFKLILGSCRSADYIIALDCDTFINCGEELVRIMEHPANAYINVLGLKMRVFPEASARSGFSSIMSGETGLDSYNLRVSNTEYDLFGQGNYTGKGIYRLRSFHEKVCNIFRDERILSHDFIEGAVAGCAECGECGLEDYPDSFSKYLARQLRWLRGDWQLLPFLLPKIKDRNNEKIKNPISPIAKFHIFSNMLYGLLPIAQILLLILSIFMGYKVCIAAVILNIIYIFNSFRISTLKSLSSGMKEIPRQIFSLALLPTVAVMNLMAILITVVRIMRGRNLLVWRTSAHFNGKISTLPNIFAAAGFFVAAYYVNLCFMIFGIIFLVGIIMNIVFSFPRKEREKIPEKSDYIKPLAYKTWQFFSDNLKEEYNYLIPDNINESDKTVAYRTSPTNIGFSMVATACAYELEFIDFYEFERIISRIINTLELLPKKNGHIFNWIDIKTLIPLEPRYVSTVDSGNLLACLMSVANYFEDPLKNRIERIIEDMDFGFLYTKRGLLEIGYDETLKRHDDNHYDLMGSESMLTYLCAIGCGKIPKEAWNNLSRQCVRYRGTMLFSWTGGMFEYLMTPLFFDFPNCSFLYKSACNVVKSQIYYAKKQGLSFWGISECQYKALDEWGNHQYKAFGIPDISLSEFHDSDVVAPYASALAYNFEKKRTINNLHALHEFGMTDRYGFYESIEGNNIIKSYMAHHQGMIMLSLTRALNKNAVIEQFRRNPEVAAAEILLSDFCDNIVAKRKKKYPIRKEFSESPYKINGLSMTPYWRFYSNNKYFLACNDRGENYSRFDGFAVDCGSETGDGIFIEYDNLKYNILISGNTVYDRHSVKYIYRNHDIMAETEISVLSGCNGDVRRIKLINTSSRAIRLDLKAIKRICLCKYEDFLAHPAFAQLNIETFYDEHLKYIYAKKKNTPLFYAHFTNHDNSLYEFDGLSERSGQYSGKFGYVLYPIAISVTEFKLEPGQSEEISLFNIVTYDKDFFRHIVPRLKTPSFAEAMVASDFALNAIFSVDKDLSEIASIIMGGCELPNRELSEYLDINLPVICESVSMEFELSFLEKSLKELSALYALGIKFNFCLIVSPFLRAKVDKIIEITDFNAKVTSGKFKIISSNDAIATKIAKNAVKHDFNRFKVIPLNECNNSKPQPQTLSVKYPLGIGGFDENFEYFLPYTLTPKPWSDVLADDGFGSIVTESGGGFTFGANSRQLKITEFRNDVVYDVPSEKIFLFDSDSGKLWSPTPKPCGTGEQWVKFGFGYCEYGGKHNGIETLLTEFVFEGNKYFVLDITNSAQDRRLKGIFACDFTLGDFTENTICALRSEAKADGICIENTINGLRAEMTCNLISDSINIADIEKLKEIPLKCNNLICFKKNTAAVLCDIQISHSETKRVVFALGKGNFNFDCQDMLDIIKKKYSNLSMIKIKCNIPEINAMLKWLPYQTYNSRFEAKAGYYQVSGAYGFRDQLQDCLALLYIDPESVKHHILLCASRQYEDGDVQHWWHGHDNSGVRTYFCDDRLFLPWLVSEYIAFTGDKSILTHKISYLKNEAIQQGQTDLYHIATKSSICESLEEHCLACIYSEEINKEGVLKIGGGDWYDAMDKIGIKGIGTTTWGTMFLYFVINKFLPYVSLAQDRDKLYRMRSTLMEGVDKCFEKDRFIRAVCDDGSVLGSENSQECKLDLLTQSWAVISGAAEEHRAREAITSAESLIDENNKIIKILSPPFENGKNIGYIADYPIGIRENGGQYTHAAVWYIISLFLTENSDKAFELLKMINPINHTSDYQKVMKYKAEPFVLCGDVYSGEHAGEGGWSWYTGAAGWLYVCYIRYLFGICINGDCIKFDPNLPTEIQEVTIEFSTSFGPLRVVINNERSEGKWVLFIGNRAHSDCILKLNPEIRDKKIIVRRA